MQSENNSLHNTLSNLISPLTSSKNSTLGSISAINSLHGISNTDGVSSLNNINSNSLDNLSQINKISTINGISADYGDSSPGFFSGLSNISVATWLIIILILSLLGFNIFIYLAKGTQDITSFFYKFLSFFGILTDRTIDYTAESTKEIITATSETINKGLTDIQNAIPDNNISQTSIKNNQNYQKEKENNEYVEHDNIQQSTNQNNDYEADEASSNIQAGVQKSGWCYVGKDRGFRSCAYVGVNDTCMSGDIFPSKEICINPNLRA